MAVIKCKMCGGDLTLLQDSTVCECEYCGTKQTVPMANDEKKLVQFERAERLRKGCEFDKASGVYESIVSEFRQEAEAYWGLVLWRPFRFAVCVGWMSFRLHIIIMSIIRKRYSLLMLIFG